MKVSWGSAAVVLAVTLSACTGGPAPLPTPTSAPSHDRHCAVPDRPTLITCREAIRIANRNGGADGLYPFEAELRNVTTGIVPNRTTVLAWAVTWHGAPMLLDGPSGGCVLATVSEFIDAHTGEWLFGSGRGIGELCPSSIPR